MHSFVARGYDTTPSVYHHNRVVKPSNKQFAIIINVSPRELMDSSYLADYKIDIDEEQFAKNRVMSITLTMHCSIKTNHRNYLMLLKGKEFSRYCSSYLPSSYY